MALSGTTLSSSSWPPSGPLTSNTCLSDFSATPSLRHRGSQPPNPETLTRPSMFLNPVTSLLKELTYQHLQSWERASSGWPPDPSFRLILAAAALFFFRKERGWGARWWDAALLQVTLMPLSFCVWRVCMHMWMYSMYTSVFVWVRLCISKGLTAQDE